MDEKPDHIRDYRDLVVWKEAMDMATDIYQVTRSFPREELFGLTSRMRRSAVSIPANIAEGFGRAQRRTFIQYLRISQGSLKELETHTILCGRAGLLSSQQVGTLDADYSRLGNRLVGFVRSLDRTGAAT